MEIYLKTMEDFPLSEMLEMKEVSGLVIGEEFCLKRELPQGWEGLAKTARQVVKAGKKVILQTPVYLTSRNFAHYLEHLTSWIKEGFISQLQIHDLGLLSCLSAPAPRLCWDAWGWQRKFPTASLPFNRPFFDYIAGLGAASFEIPYRYYRELDRKRAVIPYPCQLRLSATFPAAFGRKCYSRVLTGANCEDRPCREENLEIKPQDGLDLSYRVEGFCLGEKQNIPAKLKFQKGSKPDSVLIAAFSRIEAQKLLKTALDSFAD